MPKSLISLAKSKAVGVTAIDHNDSVVSFNLSNDVYIGARKLNSDLQGIASPDSGITVGAILYLPTGTTYTVSYITENFYKGSVIRHALDLVDNNNTVSVYRLTPILSTQGGIISHAEELIHENVPVKISVISQEEPSTDVVINTYGMLMSTKFPVKEGDLLKFGKLYTDTRVEGIKYNYPGVFEVRFDKDLKWS